MPTRTEAIKAFLLAKSHPDLASLYSDEMECQVNVAQDGGERMEGEFKGRDWFAWTDGLQVWKSFRIPWKASTEPEYHDSEINYDLVEHAEAVGMTGWNWKRRESLWVAYDFDAITGHSDKHTRKLTNDDLTKVREVVTAVPWVTLRKSTGGRGLHLYVMLPGIETANHNEHAALARAILGKLSALTGFDFQSKVDVCGSNMWVWHRKMTPDNGGLSLLKQGGVLDGTEIPANWRDHVKVVSGNRRKATPNAIEEIDKADVFEELTGQFPRTPLDEDHKKLIEFLSSTNAMWWWDQDHHILITHTFLLKKAHTEFNMRGFFDTLAQGSEQGSDYNCFLAPLRKGAWSVRRFTPGVQEHDSWEQDGAGWTRCYLNKEPDFRSACRALGGLEDPKGGFIFREAEVAQKVASYLGVHFKIDSALMGRKTKLIEHRDGRLIVEVAYDAQDRADEMAGWLPQKDKWIRLFGMYAQDLIEPEMSNYDDMVRHLVTEDHEDCGWMLRSSNQWMNEPLTHLNIALGSLGLTPKDVKQALGNSIFKCWKLVNKPFQPEYPGAREWNLNAAQLRFVPSQNVDSSHSPTWTKILKHCGAGLDEAIKQHHWCQANGITTGADYLRLWVASLFQHPTEPLPYLFFYGPQNSGKSIFHEALSLLLTKGYKHANAALTNQGGFNGELAGAILCVVEEKDLRVNKAAYNLIKEWVTARELLVHPKNETPYHTINTTHWVHCSNNHNYCPVFTGDTRIVMAYVESLDPLELIPKIKLIDQLEQEAADFLGCVMTLEIPPPIDRLSVPVIMTEDKNSAQQMNQTALERFIQEKCIHLSGRMIRFCDFFDKFFEWIDPNEAHKWSKISVSRELPPQFLKGKWRKDGQIYIGNIMWNGGEDANKAPKCDKIMVKDGYIEFLGLPITEEGKLDVNHT